MAHFENQPRQAPDLSRHGDLSLGVDLSWRLGVLIESGRIRPSDRLPGVRDLAERAGVNTNTARGLYRRLEDDGLAVSLHGSGTFVAPHVRVSPSLEELAARVSAEALSQGVDPRQLGRALYCGSPGDDPFAGLKPSRASLRAQIARLEATLAGFPDAEPTALGSRSPVPGPHIPEVSELEATRDELLDRIEDARAAARRAAARTSEAPRRREIPDIEQQGPTSRGRGPVGALVEWWRSTLSPKQPRAAG